MADLPWSLSLSLRRNQTMIPQKGEPLIPCPNCGQHHRITEETCPHCGIAVPQDQTGPRPVNDLLGRVMYGPPAQRPGDDRELLNMRVMYGPPLHRDQVSRFPQLVIAALLALFVLIVLTWKLIR